MKKYLILAILLIASPAWAWTNVINVDGGLEEAASCGATSEPAGDVFSEGFQTASTGYELTECGTAPCWAETGSPDPDASSPGTPSDEVCDQSMRLNATGSAMYASYNKNAAQADAIWIKIALYVDSESLAAWGSGTVLKPCANAIHTEFWGRLLIYDNGTTDDSTMYVRIDGSADSAFDTDAEITIDTWHVVEACIPDGGDTGDSCGEGNGVGWIRVDGGNKNTFTSNDYNGPQYYLTGWDDTDTIDLYIGYIAVDDDGTF
jgi:hypothetical protein